MIQCRGNAHGVLHVGAAGASGREIGGGIMSPLNNTRFKPCCWFASALLVTLVGSVPTRVFADCDPDGVQVTGAVYRICMPDPDRWNGDLVVYAHGYVDPDRPIEIPEEHLVIPDGPSVPQVINLLGFAFAATSYRTHGLAIRDGVEDLVDLVDVFSNTYGSPVRVYLVGISEGGLITTLAVERYPDVFDGGLAACGPIGDFQKQLNYIGDFRVLFDYFFPGVLPGSTIEIPQELVDNWDDVYVTAIMDAISADPDARERLLRVASVPADSTDPVTVDAAVLHLLWFAVHAGNDAFEKLGGQPLDNTGRRYHGGGRNSSLNRAVERFPADLAALDELKLHYRTSGILACPLVTLHTTDDPITPFWHEHLYRRKAFQAGAQPFLVNVTVDRYGHCNFTVVDLLVGFSVLVWEVTGEELVGVDAVLPRGRTRAEFMKLVRMYGVGR